VAMTMMYGDGLGLVGRVTAAGNQRTHIRTSHLALSYCSTSSPLVTLHPTTICVGASSGVDVQ